MEKQKLKSTSGKAKKMTEEERVIESLLADGAEEIPRRMWKKEPYKSFLSSIKQNGKFICE